MEKGIMLSVFKFSSNTGPAKTSLILCGLLLLCGCALSPASPTSRQNRAMIRAVEQMDIEVREIDRGVEIIFPEVLLFDYASDRLKPEARAKMHKIAEIVNAPEVASRTIAIEGHTDSIGPAAYNLDLSKRRARNIGLELVFTGVRKERLDLKGYGKFLPIAPNRKPDGSDNPEGRARNRRVEIVIEN